MRWLMRMAAIVDGCTDAYEHPKPEWRPRKENVIARLAHANESVLLVTACDKLHKVRAILLDLLEQGDDVWSTFKVGKDETLWYYHSAAAALRRHGAPARLAGVLRGRSRDSAGLSPKRWLRLP